MKIVKLFFLSILSTLVFAYSAHAFYMTFMRNLPLNYFTQQDFEMSNASVFQALEKAKDGQKIRWKNPATGAFGYVLPSGSHANCRNLKIFNSAQGVNNMASYQFCKIQGEWKIVN